MMESGKRALKALEKQVFLGPHLEVQAGFRQSEFVGHICKRRRARTLVLKSLAAETK